MKVLLNHINSMEMNIKMSYKLYGKESNLILGKDIGFGTETLLNNRSGTITIKDKVMFGHRSMVLTGYHNYYICGYHEYRTWEKQKGNNIIIEEGVWIGSGSIIVGPCIIGKNAVISAGSVVFDDVPSCALVRGNPATIIKYIDISCNKCNDER